MNKNVYRQKMMPVIWGNINENNKQFLRCFPILKMIEEHEFEIWAEKYLTENEIVIGIYNKRYLYTNRSIGYGIPPKYVWYIQRERDFVYISIEKADNIKLIWTEDNTELIFPVMRIYSIFSYDYKDLEILSFIDPEYINCEGYMADMAYSFLQYEYIHLIKAGYRLPLEYPGITLSVKEKSEIEKLNAGAYRNIDELIMRNTILNTNDECL